MTSLEDKILELKDGRVLAYTDNGNAESSTVVLFLHGAFSVGNASRPSPAILEKNVHYITPTLPGWGNSSPIQRPTDYASTLASDITALIVHLHPDDPKLELYVGGGSFGTVPAQMLYGLPYDVFPLGRHIRGLLLIAPFSPPHCHKQYAKDLEWSNYFMMGPPSYFLPFNLVPRLGKLAIGGKMKSTATAEVFLRETILDKMDGGERELFAQWRATHGYEEGQLERTLAENIVKSVAKTWDGFLSLPDVYHAGWGGVDPAKLDRGHNRRVLIVTSKDDHLTPTAMAEWLAANYKDAELMSIDGGHIAAMFQADEIWKRFFS